MTLPKRHHRALPYRAWGSIFVCIAVTSATACAERNAAGWQVPLECAPNEPSESLSELGLCVLEEYEPCRVVHDITDPAEIAITYDGRGRVRFESRTITAPAEASYEYESGRLVLREQRITDPSETRYSYGSGGRLVEIQRDITRPMHVRFDYDAGRLVARHQEVSDPSDTFYAYGEGSRLIEERREITSPMLIRYEYEDGRLRVRDRELTEPMRETFHYDARGRLARVEREVTDPQVREYRYDGRGRLEGITVTTPSGDVVRETRLEYCD